MADNDPKQLSDQSGEDGATPPAGKKKLTGKQLVLFIVLPALLLLGGGGAGAYFFIFKKKPAAEGADAAQAEKDKKKKDKKSEKKSDKGGEKKGGEGEAKISEGPDGQGFLTMPPMVVNIATPDGRSAYLKLRLTLQAKDLETIEVIEPMLPPIMDQFNGFLRELRMEDVSGSAGYARIQLELLKRVNLAVAPAQIDAVLIEEMLVN
ncbi:MAG: hypothetical protein RL186_1421 [Pseudomonadota bacterium]|jgi:flagellar FliL protein